MNMTLAKALVQMLLSCQALFSHERHPTSVQMTVFQYTPKNGITAHKWTDDTEEEVQKIKFNETGFGRIQLQMAEEDGKVVLGGQVGQKATDANTFLNCPVAGDMDQIRLVIERPNCNNPNCFYRMKDMVYRLNAKADEECVVFNLTGNKVMSRIYQPEVDCSSPLGLNPEENFFVFKKDGECKEVDYSVLNTTWTSTACAEHKIDLEPNVYSKFYHLRYLMALSGCGQNMTDTNVIDNTYVKFLYKPTEPAKLNADNHSNLIMYLGVGGGLLVILIVLLLLVLVFRRKQKGCVAGRRKRNNGDKEDSKVPEKVEEKDVPVKDLAVKKTEEVKPKEEPAKQEKSSVVDPLSVSKDEFGKGMKVLKEKSERAKKAEEKRKRKKEWQRERKKEEDKEREKLKEKEKEMDKKNEIILKAAEKLGLFALPKHELVLTEMVVDEKTKYELPKIIHCKETYSYSGFLAAGRIRKVFKYETVSTPSVVVAVKFVNKNVMTDDLKEIMSIKAVQPNYEQIDELYLLEMLEYGQFPKFIFTITPLYYRRMTFFAPKDPAFMHAQDQERYAVAWHYLKCIRQLHLLGFGHNDIKPASFMQKAKDSNTLILCNFGKVKTFGAVRETRDDKADPYYPLTAYEMKKTSNVDDYQSWLFMLTVLVAKKYEWTVHEGTPAERVEERYKRKIEYFGRLHDGVSAERKLLHDLSKAIIYDHGPEEPVEEKEVVRILEEFAKEQDFAYEGVDWGSSLKEPPKEG